MKQKPRSFIALLLTAVLTAALLCGCHSKPENSSACHFGKRNPKHCAADTDTDQRQHARLIYGLLRQHFAARYLSVLAVHTVRSHGEYATDRISARRFGKRR